MCTLSDISTVLEVYRSELARNGLINEAQSLYGTEVNSPQEAHTAIEILKSMRAEDTNGVRQHIISLLEQAA